MRQISCKLSQSLLKSYFPNQLIAKALMLGLLILIGNQSSNLPLPENQRGKEPEGERELSVREQLPINTLGMSVSTLPPIALRLVVAQKTDTKEIAQQLLGRWQAQDPVSKEEFTFIFAPEGELFMVLPTPEGSSIALKIDYQINPAAQPMQLDIQLSADQKLLTIFEITTDGKLRLELDGLEPGLSRPTEFQNQAIFFEKTSELTTVPEDIQVITLAKLNNQMSGTPEEEAKKYMYALTQVQQAHYLEQGKFATAIEQVSIGLRTETEYYRYQFLPQGDGTKSVIITAIAKDSELPSYTGAVFAIKTNEGNRPLAQICKTDQPSTQPPTILSVPTDNSSEVECPMGSSPVQF